MLDASQIVTPFNVLSHNVAHSCDYATIHVDCWDAILQYIAKHVWVKN
jgi:hypothetical protein